jgi:hypothetical protein
MRRNSPHLLLMTKIPPHLMVIQCVMVPKVTMVQLRVTRTRLKFVTTLVKATQIARWDKVALLHLKCNGRLQFAWI